MSHPSQFPNKSQPGWAIWLTGLPASGKSTIAHHLQGKLHTGHIQAVVLDSDALRSILDPAPRYDDGGRQSFYERMVKLAELLVIQGVNVILAATGNRRAYRQVARTRLPRYAEVWVQCPLEVCRARDPKGLYARAISGEIENFPGVHTAYEPPIAPDLVINSERQTPNEAVDSILASLSCL